MLQSREFMLYCSRDTPSIPMTRAAVPKDLLNEVTIPVQQDLVVTLVVLMMCR